MLSYRVELYNREDRGRIGGNGYLVAAVIDGCRAYTVDRCGSDKERAHRIASRPLTKREFDNVTKRNWRGKGMASDERHNYRSTRHLPTYGCPAYAGNAPAPDKLAQRAAWRRANPHLATLGLGSPMRAPVEWRLMGRLPRVRLTSYELAALARGE